MLLTVFNGETFQLSGSQAAAAYGQNNQLNAMQGSQGSMGGINAGQYSNGMSYNLYET